MEMKVECNDNNMTRETISSSDLSHQIDIQMAGAESLEHTSGSGLSSGNGFVWLIIKIIEKNITSYLTGIPSQNQ